MEKKTPHSDADLSQPKREIALLRALNAAAASLQRSAHSEAEVLEAFREQIAQLGLRGGITLLDEEREQLVVRVVAYPGPLLSGLEKLVGTRSEGFSFPVTQVDIYRQVVESGETVFVPDSSVVVSQMLPEAARPFARRILKAFGSPPAIYAPLTMEGRVQGVLNIVGAELTPNDALTIEAFAHHISVALDNARLYAETRATRDYYDALLNSLHDEVLVINRDYIITDVNQPLLRRTGYARQEVLGRYCYEVSHQLDSPCWENTDHPCPVREVWERQRSARTTHIHYDRDGRPIYVDIATSPLFDQSGQLVGAIEAYRDVTAERRLEERLEAIYQLGRELTLIRDEATIVRRVLEIASSALQFEVAACGLVDEEAGELQYQYLAGAGLEARRLHLPLDGDRGIGVAVVQSGRAINLPDTTQDPRYVPGDWPARSELCVPIKVGDQVIGVLNVESSRPYHFTSSDEQVLQTLADQTAIALENAWLYQAEHARRQELEAVRQASLSLTASLELNHVLNAIARAAFDLVSASNTDIFLYSEGKLTFGADMRAGGPQDRPYAPPRPGGLTYTVARRGEAIVVSDMRNHPLFADAPSDWRGSIVGLPLKFGEQVVGVMNVARSEPGGFSSAELRALRLLADQAAIAIENARLHAETEQRAKHLAVLHELDRAITASLRITEVYHAFAQHARRLLPYHRMSIALLEGETMRVTYVAGDDETEPAVGTALPYRGSAIGWVTRHKQPLLRHDIAADLRFAEDEQLVTSGIRASIIIPLQVKGEVIGTWNIGSRQVGAYAPGDLSIARTMADQLAIAIENARLHEDLQTRIKALQEAQARLVQSEKLAAIGELVAGVAHELNNPLTSIIGFAQLLQHTDIAPEARRDLDKIVAQAQRAAGIVRGLLDFARQRPPERRPVQINDVLDATLDLLAYELHTHNVKWSTHFAPDLPLTMADPYQLQQVFVNLIHNARQVMSAAHNGGHLTLTTEVRQTSTPLDRQTEGKQVIRVTVQDDGPGIPSKDLPRIFDPFFTTKPPGEGTGLGLSVCHGIVSEHGGHIWAESEPGQGATFIVELPIIAPIGRSWGAAHWAKQSLPARSAHILAIDDEVEILEMLTRVLGRQGYQVDAVSDGESGLARMAEKHYDLILCDVRMPGLSGPEVYQRVRAQDPDLAQRIIFTTGDTISPATRRFLEETGVPYLSKPFFLTELLEKVQAAIVEQKR